MKGDLCNKAGFGPHLEPVLLASSAVLPSNSAPPLVPFGQLGMSSGLAFFSMGVSVEVGSKLKGFCSSDPVSSSGCCSAVGMRE